MRYWIFVFFLAILFLSCEEIGPTIEIIPPARKVVVEEFTGVQCVNCPEGAEKLEDLLEIHGENLIVVSIHSGFFAVPLSESNIDFRIPEGSEIDALLGPVTGYPSATVNRKLFSGENSRIVPSTKWAGFVQGELAIPSPVEMELNVTFDAATRDLQANVSMVFFQDLTGPVHLSVMVTENNVTDAQLDLSGLTEDYVHRHVLRDMLTPSDGTVISEPTVANSPLSQTFTLNVPADWKENDLAIVAFVHRVGSEFDVLQAEELKLIQ